MHARTSVTEFPAFCYETPCRARQARSIGSVEQRTGRRNHMEYRTLGRTGLRVSVAGLGCGGNSRLGLGTGKSEAEAIALVRAALDLGVTFFDTAAAYGTEAVLGKALKGVPRERIVIATKASWGPLSPERVVASLDRSLRRLGTDYIDVFQLHGVSPAAYAQAREVVAPALLRERDKGKLRFLGITEAASSDAEHRMLERAAADGMGHRHGRLSHAASECARAGLSVDAT